MPLFLGECDCCNAERPLRLVIAYGIETAACAICRGGDTLDLIEEFEELNEALAPPGGGTRNDS